MKNDSPSTPRMGLKAISKKVEWFAKIVKIIIDYILLIIVQGGN